MRGFRHQREIEKEILESGERKEGGGGAFQELKEEIMAAAKITAAAETS